MPISEEFLAAAGGLGLFLLGMGVMTDSLKQLAGASLGRWLARSTRSPTSGAVTGALTTAAVQSSSATTVAAVGFVAAGLLTFEQALGVEFGANVGTTITGWMVALLGFKLDLGAIAPLLVFAGALLRLMGRGRLSAFGGAVAGFGLVFTGIDVLQSGMAALGASITPESFPQDTIGGRVKLVGIGFLITLVTQSSSAGVATALAAVHGGAVSFQQAAAMVIGMDVGTTFTALIATLGGEPSTRRTGYAHVVYNSMTAVGAFLLLVPYARVLEAIHAGVLAAEPELALVGFHTFFNLLGLFAVLPFAGPFARLMTRLVPETGSTIDSLLDRRLQPTPAVALEASAAATRRLARSTLRFCARDLRRPMEASARRAGFARVQQQASRIHAFVTEIVTPRSDQRTHTAHVALIAAIDHLVRLAEHMETRHPVTVGRTQRRDVGAFVARRARGLGAKLLTASLNMRDGGSGARVDRLKAAWAEQAEGADDLRDRILTEAASGEVAGDRATACLDEDRHLVRIARHSYRMVEHLARAGERLVAAVPVNEELPASSRRSAAG